MFSIGQIIFALSKVDCKSVSPVPRTSKNCFGLLVLDIGQNLLPIPPAIMIQKFLFSFSPCMITHKFQATKILNISDSKKPKAQIGSQTDTPHSRKSQISNRTAPFETLVYQIDSPPSKLIEIKRRFSRIKRRSTRAKRRFIFMKRRFIFPILFGAKTAVETRITRG